MKTVKILHCADIHIGAKESFLEEKAEFRRRETLLTFERVMDLAVDNNADIILIAGDLFHHNQIESSFVNAVIDKIKSVKIPVVYCGGNHDPYNETSPLKRYQIPNNFYIFPSEESVFTFESLGVKIFGRSFESASLKGKAIPDLIPDNDGCINISLLHGDLGSDLSSQYNPITREFIEKSKMDYIALGHIHKQSEVGKIGGTYFAYSGCPEGQGFDELGTKGVLLGEIGKNICNLEFIPTSKRIYFEEKVDITGKEAEITDSILEILYKKHGDGFSENLYKISLIGNIQEEAVIDLAEISARINEKVYFAKIKDKTEPIIDYEKLAEEKNLKGIFVKKMLEKIKSSEDKEKYENALRLGLKAFSGEVKFNED